MDFKKHALILEVVETLHKQNSWTGKTHVQKTLFLMEAIASVSLPFDFILYKHGPYSFDIESEMEEMKGYFALTSVPVPGYGVTLNPGEKADFIRQKASLTPKEKKGIERVCKFVGTKDVRELERLATIAWIHSREGIHSTEAVTTRLHELKPHISLQEAEQAQRDILPFLSENLATTTHLGG